MKRNISIVSVVMMMILAGSAGFCISHYSNAQAAVDSTVAAAGNGCNNTKCKCRPFCRCKKNATGSCACK